MGKKTHVCMPGRRTGKSLAVTLLIAPLGKTDAAALAWATSPMEGVDGSTPLGLVQQGKAGEVLGATRLTLAGLKRACQAGLDARGPNAEPVVDRSGGGRC